MNWKRQEKNRIDRNEGVRPLAGYTRLDKLENTDIVRNLIPKNISEEIKLQRKICKFT
jgi:hypothetical protein